MRSPHSLCTRLMTVLLTMAPVVVLAAPAASGHVEGGASAGHAVWELGRTAAMVAVVVAAAFAVFWMRARASGRRHPS